VIIRQIGSQDQGPEAGDERGCTDCEGAGGVESDAGLGAESWCALR